MICGWYAERGERRQPALPTTRNGLSTLCVRPRASASWARSALQECVSPEAATQMGDGGGSLDGRRHGGAKALLSRIPAVTASSGVPGAARPRAGNARGGNQLPHLAAHAPGPVYGYAMRKHDSTRHPVAPAPAPGSPPRPSCRASSRRRSCSGQPGGLAHGSTS